MNRRDCIRWAGAASAGLLLSSRAFAQAKYPQGPIRLIVPYAPGGVVDSVSRNWAERMKTPLGTVIVDNRSGAGGTIGATVVAHATADGQTLLFGDTSSQIIAPYLMINQPYDTAKDFAAVSMIATSSTAIVVHPSVPATTLEEFIKYAKTSGRQLSYASAGTGTSTHLAGELFKQLIGKADILHVPYRGGGPGLIDLIAGVVPMMTPVITSQVLGFHRAGQVRILAVCAPARLKAAPDIPAAVETVPGLSVQLTIGVLAPAGTPQSIIDQIAAANVKAMQDPDFDRLLEASGLEARSDVGPAAAKAFLIAEREHLVPIIEAAGLHPQ
jgi:tripartite-type tricarboxylate transporter receptor subunit TctC